jgi:uncharacterized protein (DUF433 family)
MTGDSLVCNQEVAGSIPVVSTHFQSRRVVKAPTEADRMETPITLVDRGRRLQLSASRITVHDLVPYFQAGCPYDEIIRWIPALTHDEIAIVERYYRQHQDELDEYEGQVQAYRMEQIGLQRLPFPECEGSRHERLARLRQLLQQRRRENNGEGTHR